MFEKLKFNILYYFLAPFKLNKLPSFYSSHSQFGEDMMLRGFFGNKKNGFYVDIGAHHPIFYSNTYHFYLRGWSGINIEATPEVITLFNKKRPRDKNLNVCVGESSENLVTFYEFDQPALNTTQSEVAKESEAKGFKLVRKREMQTQNINELLKEKLPSNKQIDFLTIDIEGLDFVVLQTLDFEHFSPKAIVVEDHNFKIEKPHSNILSLLQSKGYTLEGKCGPSLMFIKKDSQ